MGSAIYDATGNAKQGKSEEHFHLETLEGILIERVEFVDSFGHSVVDTHFKPYRNGSPEGQTEAQTQMLIIEV